MKRGDVYWASVHLRSGSEQRGDRPVIIVSNDGFNNSLSWNSLIVVPLTTSLAQGKRGPTVITLPAGVGGLSKGSFALCHQVTTLDRSKLIRLLGSMDRSIMSRIASGLKIAQDLE